MPVRNKPSKHQRRPKPLGISSKELEANNQRNRAIREQKEADEQARIERQLEHERRFREPAKKPKKVFDFHTPAFIRPIFGLPREVQEKYTHNYELVPTDIGAIAIFAGEPRLANTSGKISGAHCREDLGKISLFGRLPKNLLGEFGRNPTEANPQHCRLLNIAPNRSQSLRDNNPRHFGVHLGVALEDLGMDLRSINESLGEIFIGGAHDLDGYPIGEPRQKRPDQGQRRLGL